MQNITQDSSLANWNALPPNVLRSEPDPRAEEHRRAVGGLRPDLEASGQGVKRAEERYTEEEWEEWHRLQRGSREDPYLGGDTAEIHQGVAEFSARESYPIDPALEMGQPFADDLALSYAAGRQSFFAAMQREPAPEWEQRHRLVSSSTVIDHGSPPPPSPGILDQPLLAPSGFSKEEWLRLGGFVETDYQQEYPLRRSQGLAPNAETAPLPPYSFPPLPLPLPYSDLNVALPPLPPLPVDSGPVAPKPKGRSRSAPASRPKRARPAPYPRQPLFPEVEEAEEVEDEELVSDDIQVDKDLGAFNVAPAPSVTTDIPWRPGKMHSRVPSPGHIPRPRNAFILFRQHALATKLIPSELGIKNASNASQVIGAVWKSLPAEERKRWNRLAEEEKQRHAEMYPGYKYAPKSKEGIKKRAAPGAGKRRVGKALEEREDLEVDQLESDDDFAPSSSSKKSPSKRKSAPSPRKKKPTASKAKAQINQSVPKPQPFTPKESTEDIATRMEMVGQLISYEQQQQSPRSTPQKARARHSPYSRDSPSVRSSSPLSASSSSASTPRQSRSSLGPPQPSSSARQPKSFGSLGVGPGASSLNAFLTSSTAAAFDNSPLLGAVGGERKSSRGRWELRKPSESRRVSRREMLAQQEESEMGGQGHGRRREVSKAFTIDPRLFLAEAGLEDEYYDGGASGGGQHAGPYVLPPLDRPSSIPSSSALPKNPYSLPTPPLPSYHFGAQDLFSAPAPPLGFGGGGEIRTISESARGLREEDEGESRMGEYEESPEKY